MASAARGQSKRALDRFARVWRLVMALSASATKNGLGVRRLMEETGASRSTLYRDLEVLEAGGVLVTNETINGEARYRLMRDAELPPLGYNVRELAVLHIARAALEPLAGTALIGELEAMLAKIKPAPAQQTLRLAEPDRRHAPEALGMLERALVGRRRAVIDYRAASHRGETTRVHVEPLLIRVAAREPYVRAFCVERGAERTYKVARIVRVALTDEPSTYRPARPVELSFERAIKAWSGDECTVHVRLEPDVAWLANEYPLVKGQRVEELEDGGALVKGRVSGIVEAMRWVLSWGGAAEAIEPPELREAVRAELVKAVGKYESERQRDERPGPAKATSSQKAGRRSARVTQAETRGG